MERLAAFCEATYLLARFHPPTLRGWLAGRFWEHWVSLSMPSSAGWQRQFPGQLSLFGSRSASGLRHELDGAAAHESWTLVVEAKAYGDRPPTKADVMYFDRKTFDLFVARRRDGERGPHYRVLVSATPLDEPLQQYCYSMGIVVVDPDLLPLPMLLRMASKPSADLFFSDMALAEFVRLAEPAAGPIESRYVPDGPHHLRLDLRVLAPSALQDLSWLHRQLSSEVLELVDAEAPDFYEGRAREHLARLGPFLPDAVGYDTSVHA